MPGSAARSSTMRSIVARTALAAGLAALALASCGTRGDATTTGTDVAGFTGADGVTSQVIDTSRIVTLSGDLTEIVYALGLGGSVVATDITTVYPPEAVDLPVVGLGRFLTAEGVLAQNPTLVLGDTQTSPPEAIDQIRSAGVPVVILNIATSFPALYDKVTAIGQALGVEAAGNDLADRIRADIDESLAAVGPFDPPPRVAFVYSRGPDVMLLFGSGMTTKPLIEAAGGVDAGAASGVTETVSVTPEALVAAAPDVIVTTQEGLDALGGLDGMLATPGFAETPAGRSRRILAYPEGDILTFGPRIGRSLDTLIADLRRELAAP